MPATDRRAFAVELEADANSATARFYNPAREWPQVASLSRRKGTLHLALPSRGYGLALHRNGGISFCGVPSSGGTTICWANVRRRVRAYGTKHRAIELGPVGIYIGRDF